MLPSAPSWNVKLMLAKDTSFVERLPGDNASTRSVGCEGSGCTAPTVETDVLPETPNMFSTAVLGTSVSKRVLVILTGPARMYTVAGPKHLLTNRRSRASGRSCRKWTCSLASSTRSCPRQPMQSCRVCPRHAKTDSRPPNRPGRCCPKLPRAPASFSVDKALPSSQVDDAVSPASSMSTT